MKQTKHTRIRLAFSCPKKLDQMQKTKAGFHCTSCSKTVQDHRTKSDSDLGELNPESQGHCGMFTSSQLIRHWKSVWLSAATILACIGQLEAQPAPLKISLQNPEPVVNQDSVKLSIQGQIVSETGEGIPFVNVILYNGDSIVAGSSTDMDGNYSIRLTVLDGQNFRLEADKFGYASQTIEIPIKGQRLIDLQINLSLKDDETVFLGMVHIVFVDPPPFNSPKVGGSGKTYTQEEINRQPR